MITPFARQERDDLLQSRRAALSEYNRLMDQSEQSPPWGEAEARALAEAERHMKAAAEAEREYFERLPRLTVSCCPFDGRPLVRSFDPYGFDGLWWRPDASPEEAPVCPHFCALAGAVNLAGHKPRTGEFAVYPGPEAPYVIPRLLEHPEMVAIISELRMADGYVAYPVAYFAARRPAPQHLTAGWARSTYTYKTQLGEGGWRVPNDLWDFDLLPWLKAGKVRWCPSGSDNSALSAEAPDRCPYLDVNGERQRLVLRGNRVLTAGVPDGELVWQLDY